MLFTQPLFFAFFGVTLALAWSVPTNRGRKIVLLTASYLFYAAWDWRFLSLILASTLVDFVAARAIAGSQQPARRKGWLMASLAMNLGILGFFKYFGFFVRSAGELLGGLGWEQPERTLSIVLPVGISFFTFQTLSYTIDVYRRKLRPATSPLDFALFVAFFPQLVAGPIVRASTFLPQLRHTPSLAALPVRLHLTRFLVGFVKKSCIADQIAPHVDLVFAEPTHWSAASVWIAVLLYAIQIYCDFSGYTDMAIACAGLLGYDFEINFRFPYLASNLSDFWHRWHISLSTWLRDYLYIPLGGSRGPRRRTYRNLLITMLLGGLWHGAAWTFVLWGALHGAGLLLHRALASRVSPQRGWIPRALGTLATGYFVCFAWIFFRAQSVGDAWVLARSFLLLDPGSTATLNPALLAWPAVLLPVHWLCARGWGRRAFEATPSWAFSFAYGAAVAVALAFVPLRTTPFLYFQF